MKKIFLTVALFSLVVSCKDDYLDIKQEGQTEASSFFKTQDDAMQATSAIYSFLRSWENSAFPYQFVFGVPADDVVKGSNPGDSAFINVYDNFTYTVSDEGVRGYWIGQWQAVNRTNQVITHVPAIQMDTTLKNRLIAEAKMLRAYFYFNLVRIYGGVPIYDKVETVYEKPRNSVEEVYNFIISDLTAAAEVLPQTYPSSDLGRVTKGAALGLLSKVYLYKKDWQKAYETSNQVIAMGYNLDPDFNHLFRPAGEFGSESVFEVNCQCSSQYGGSQYAQVQGVRNQFGWGFFTPSNALENAFEAGDIRKELTILRNGETTPEGDLIAMGDPLSVTTFNQKVYVPKALNNNACDYGSIQNIRILRFAEILLINAEAANELGNISAATINLNKVRTRAGLAGTTASNQAALRTAIWHERRVELALEGDRFVDLVRTGQAATVLAPYGFKAGKNEVFPIPLDAMDQSHGAFIQNPGY
ncbi:RagB/SusD family nutrient uptake outer membrane protein [Chryseobacterium sp. PTM-20240506]|uniref:RagB/SusD family nutrient uptake outer membrane protein n=1 Tax=unclassified Chryseobacterium TaxID=2593645 RepID=UPI002358726B|nr:MULTISPECIES: RagB/SusD family nutrient uptake outer membrane protein [unclassified Chryseobacterium]MDC8104450.1 RagB/SusD family nutrient uptake outer membrane protein [Chryseobacterium sp. B21-037]MDQ1804064.1 RagB/SusD family nutrient uptake outer membrane protein [Chryseobacterium sp. CKR4-1]